MQIFGETRYIILRLTTTRERLDQGLWTWLPLLRGRGSCFPRGPPADAAQYTELRLLTTEVKMTSFLFFLLSVSECHLVSVVRIEFQSKDTKK